MLDHDLAKLAAAIQRKAAADGSCETAVPALKLSRISAPSDLVSLVYEPSLCFVPGRRKLWPMKHRSPIRPPLLVSVDLPVAARVVEASPNRPYLAVRIALDTAVVGELLADGVTAPPAGASARAIAVTPVEPALLRNAVTVQVALLDSRGIVAARPRPLVSTDHVPAYRAARDAARTDRFGQRSGSSGRKRDPLVEEPFRRSAEYRVTRPARPDEPIGASPAL